MSDEPLKVGQIVVPKDEFTRLYQENLKKQRNVERRRRISNAVKDVAIVALLVANVWEGVAVAKMATTATYTPVFVYQRDDGTVTNSLAYASLPANVQAKSEINALWQYVRLREGWSASEAEYAWNVVSAMSADNVRTDYQNWQNDKKTGPRYVLGEDGQVEVRFVNYAPVCPQAGCPAHPDTFIFFFDRIERRGRAWSEPARYSVSLQFSRLPQLPWWLVSTVDSPGLLVTVYPGGRPVGVPAR